MRLILATLLLTFALPAFAGLDCDDILQSLQFWKPSPATLVKAVKEGKAILLKKSIRSNELAQLSKGLAPLQQAAGGAVIAYDADTKRASQLSKYLPIGSGLYVRNGSVFTYLKLSQSAQRLPQKLARQVLEGLGINPQIIDFTRLFEAKDVTYSLFLEGPLASNWTFVGNALKGEVTMHRGVDFFTLKFFAMKHATIFNFRAVTSRYEALRKPDQTSRGHRVSEQMRRLLNPREAEAMVEAGKGTLDFLRELNELGFVITGTFTPN